MPTVSSRVLSLSAEAAILVRAGRSTYANARAEKLIRSMTDALGKDGFVSAALIPPALASACPDMGDAGGDGGLDVAFRAAARPHFF